MLKRSKRSLNPKNGNFKSLMSTISICDNVLISFKRSGKDADQETASVSQENKKSSKTQLKTNSIFKEVSVLFETVHLSTLKSKILD